MLILAVGIGIVFCIIVFICYSYKQNQRSKYTSEVYKVFKGQYGRESVISMGYAQTNAFTEPVTLMLAVSKDDHRVVDAWEVTQEEMENSCRSCEEYIGMDLIKYYKENQERIEKSQMMNQTMGRDSAKKQAFDMAVQQILRKIDTGTHIMEEIKKEIIEKVILVAVADQDTTEAEESLDELEELVKTAGAEVAARVIQVRETPHPGTYIGKGKIDEVNALLYGTNATGIVCDDELSPAQISNLEEALDTKVMDRTLIILDIFAKRAFTREGKIQVELAQLKYRASKLTGQGRALSRLGGGIGTRGPGEKKLEMDRRLIRTRISRLKAELRDVVKHREVQRKQRQKNHLPVVCIVGYTNAGKSTLLNHFTNAGVYEEDQLFATLDPTTKSLDLSGGQTILMTDTVGFIRKLPHHLVEAFKSTLEEAKYSDLILHVVDASNPQKEKQMEAVYDTLKQLGANESPIITAFNKIDLLNGDEILKDPNAEAVVRISGKNGEGTDQLLEQIEKILQKQKLYLEKLYGYQEAGKIQLIRSHGQLLKEEYRDDGIYVEAYIPKEILGSI